MELPHWLMAVGAVLLAVGFIGSVLHKNEVTSNPDTWEGDQTAEARASQDGATNPPSAAAAS
jgi:hypothetical protein